MAREPITFRVPPEIKRQFFSKLALRGEKAQDVLEDFVNNFLSSKEDDMELSKNMVKVLTDLGSGSDKPALKSAYNARTIEALEERGLITVRDIDGELRLTTSGIDWLFKNRSAREVR